jgi:hypothetical protein
VITEVGDAVAEPALVNQVEVQLQILRQGAQTAAHHLRYQEQLVLVDQAGPNRLGREVRAADGEIPLRDGL